MLYSDNEISAMFYPKVSVMLSVKIEYISLKTIEVH